MTALDLTQLHGALNEPVLGSLTFLNEVMSRFPDAISFAPGAPAPSFTEGFDAGPHITRFVHHLVHTRGLRRDQANRLLVEYGPSQGIINDLIAQALTTDLGADVDPGSVVVTVGAQEALLLTIRALCGPGDALAVVSPCFVGATGAARLLGVDVLPVAERDGDIDADALLAHCAAARARGGRVRALYVAPDHANPSGTLLDIDTRRMLLDLAQEHDFYLIEDSAYAFTGDRSAPPLKALDTDGRVILVGTFAKMCLPGARVGFAVADQPVTNSDSGTQPLATHLATAKTMVTVNTAPLCQAVIGGMLLEHDVSLARLAQEKANHYRASLAHLLAALDREIGTELPVTWNRPTGGFFVRMRLPLVVDTALLDVSARQFGVLWTPMTQFHLDDGGRHELRLSCSYLTHPQIDDGVARLAKFLNHATTHQPSPT